MEMKNLSVNEFKLFDTILFVAHSLDEELRELNNTGVFFVPELHLVFEVGKAIYKNRKAIFGTEDIKWIREKDLGNGGPSDLVFETIGKTPTENVVLEFKIASTSTTYVADINKLEKLKRPDQKNHLYFVALVDSFQGKEDPRVKSVFQETGYKPFYDVSFHTNYSGYKSKIDCIVAFYII